MPTAKYNGIYKSLREKIEAQEYEYQSMLPSEYQLINLYACSRNTTRRAIKQLADEKYMDLNGYNCLAVVSSNTYNDEGIMFEYTQSRHRADRFMFYEQAQRVKQNTAGNIGKMESV